MNERIQTVEEVVVLLWPSEGRFVRLVVPDAKVVANTSECFRLTLQETSKRRNVRGAIQ